MYKTYLISTFLSESEGTVVLVTDRHLQIIEEIYTHDNQANQASSREAAYIIFRITGDILSEPTVRRYRALLGWKACRTVHCHSVRPANRIKRLEYCLNLQATGLANFWEDCIFTDEASFWLEKHGRITFQKVHRDPHTLKVINTGNVRVEKPKHVTKVHVWGGISVRGPTRICIFTGNMNADFYVQILEGYLVPFITSVYPDGHRFIQDNDPKHTSKKGKECITANSINWFPTPPESPDLNPIEMIWAEMKHFIRKIYQPQNQQELVTALDTYWNSSITPDVCRKYIGHIEKVIPLVIKAEGGPSGH